MKQIKRRSVLKGIGASGIVGLSGCSGDGNQDQTPGQAGGTTTTTSVSTFENKAGKPVGATPEAVEQLASEEEGTLNIYSVLSTGEFRPLIDGFNEAYPELNVQHTTGGSSDLVNKWSTEYNTDNVTGDILQGGSIEGALGTGQAMELSADYLPSFGEYPDKFKSSDGEWMADRIQPGAIFYNTETVSPSDASGWTDIVNNDQWSGQNIGWDPTPNIPLMTWFRNEHGQEFFEKLKSQNPRFVDSHTDLARFVGAGEFPISFTYAIKYVDFAIDKGLPVDFFKFDSLPTTFSITMINNKSSIPNTAALFVNWLMSVEGQNVMGETLPPAHPDAEYARYPELTNSDEYEFSTVSPTASLDETRQMWSDVMGQ